MLFKTLTYTVQLLGLVSHYCYFSKHQFWTQTDYSPFLQQQNYCYVLWKRFQVLVWNCQIWRDNRNSIALSVALPEAAFAQLSDPQCHYSSLSEMFMNSGCAVTLSRSRPARFHEWMIFPSTKFSTWTPSTAFQNLPWNTFRFYQDDSACWQQ